jgi:hypothetical protein
MKNSHKTYCSWAKTMVQEDPEVSPGLLRFVKWLSVGDKVDIKQERATASSSQQKRTGQTYEEARDLENAMIHEMGPEAQEEMKKLAARMAELRKAHNKPKGMEEKAPPTPE